jgi:hypothetical protein
MIQNFMIWTKNEIKSVVRKKNPFKDSNFKIPLARFRFVGSCLCLRVLKKLKSRIVKKCLELIKPYLIGFSILTETPKYSQIFSHRSTTNDGKNITTQNPVYWGN